MSTDAVVQITPDSTGKKIDNSLVITTEGTVYRQRVEVYPGDDLINVETGLDQPLTDTQLRATPITVYAHPVEYEVQHEGTLGGKAAALYHIMGSRTLGWSSTSILGDACEYLNTSQALMNTPTSQQLYLVSTNDNDGKTGAPNSIGARTVRVVYLDGAGLQQVVTYALDGTTPVPIMADATFIQWMEVSSVGSNEVAVGDLAITSTNGAATIATTFEFIKAGGNRSLSGRYKVPSGCHAHLIHWDVGAIGTSMDTRLRATVFADDNALSTTYHFLDRVFLASGVNTTQHLEYRELPSGCVVKISAFPGNTQAGNKLDCSFSLIVMDN